MRGPELDTLIQMVARLPGLGQRSARRLVLKLLQAPETRMLPLAAALAAAARAVRTCSQCGNLDSLDPCSICCDQERDRSMVCVVETVGDLWALERARVHNGLYHVLGGTLSALSGTGPDDLNLAPLLARVAGSNVGEGDTRVECDGGWGRHIALAGGPACSEPGAHHARGTGCANRRRARCAR